MLSTASPSFASDLVHMGWMEIGTLLSSLPWKYSASISPAKSGPSVGSAQHAGFFPSYRPGLYPVLGPPDVQTPPFLLGEYPQAHPQAL